MTSNRPHRALHPHIRCLVKTGIGILTADGFRAHHATECERSMADGRRAFLQLNATERGLLVNVYFPKAILVRADELERRKP